MFHRLTISAVALITISPLAAAQNIYNQSALNTGNSIPISAQTIADDFKLQSPSSITGISVFLADDEVNNNGLLDSFGGSLGWGIFSDGGTTPGTLLHSGTVIEPTPVDTGLQDGSGSDIVRVDLTVDVPTLPAGIYWLGLHEGNWGGGSDGSNVWWQGATASGFQSLPGDDQFQAIDTNASPGFQWTSDNDRFAAFILVPEPASLALVALALPLLRRRRAQ